MDPSRVAQAAQAARAAWPEISAPLDEFEGFLGARAPDGLPPPERCAELYLTFACARGDGAALQALEERYLPAIERKLRRRTGSAALAREALQMWRENLFVAAPGRAPRIADFGGGGPLAGWLMVVAGRIALRLFKKERRDAPLEEVVAARLADRQDLELAVVEKRYGGALQAALGDAFRALDADERTLLRHRYLDDCSIETIAAIHRVHRATAARWLQRVEKKLIDGCVELLAARLGTSKEELVSVLRLVRSRLDLSIRAVVRG